MTSRPAWALPATCATGAAILALCVAGVLGPSWPCLGAAAVLVVPFVWLELR